MSSISRLIPPIFKTEEQLAICGTEDVELQELDDVAVELIKQVTPSLADVTIADTGTFADGKNGGVKEYEDILDIKPLEVETDLYRKTRVLRQIADKVPYTYNNVKDWFSLWGVDAEFNINYNNGNVEVVCSATELVKNPEIARLIDRILPMNLFFSRTEGTNKKLYYNQFVTVTNPEWQYQYNNGGVNFAKTATGEQAFLQNATYSGNLADYLAYLGLYVLDALYSGSKTVEALVNDTTTLSVTKTKTSTFELKYSTTIPSSVSEVNKITFKIDDVVLFTIPATFDNPIGTTYNVKISSITDRSLYIPTSADYRKQLNEQFFTEYPVTLTARFASGSYMTYTGETIIDTTTAHRRFTITPTEDDTITRIYFTANSRTIGYAGCDIDVYAGQSCVIDYYLCQEIR